MLNIKRTGFLFGFRKKKSTKSKIKNVNKLKIKNKNANNKLKIKNKNANNKLKIKNKNANKIISNHIKRAGGRLGDQIIVLIPKIIIHYKYNHRIDSIQPNKTDISIFIKALQKTLLENYKGKNQLSSKIREIFFTNKSCLPIVVPFCTLDLQKDIKTAFREIPLYEIYRNNIIKMSNIKLPIYPKRTIAVHIRLGDCANKMKWTSLQPKGFKNVIHSINNNVKIQKSHNKENTQCPINTKIIQKIINIAKKDFPTHEVVIFCEPRSNCNLPYRCIQSSNPDNDLICLMLSDVLIGAHSNFSLSAFMFHEGSKAYLPMWGHHAFHGLGTKFDNTNVCFFNGYNGNILKI